MRRLMLLVGVVGVSACGKAEYPGPLLPPPARDAALTALSGCDDLAGALCKHIIQEMDRRLEKNMQAAYDRECSSFWDIFDGMYAADAAAPPVPLAAEGPSAYTTTNLQVAGVDEPDLVKNDDARIYLVSGNELLILAAWPAAETRIVGRVTIAGTPRRLFVRDGRAVVYADDQLGYATCWGPPGTPPNTFIHVFDLQDTAAPKLVRTIRAQGRFVAARMVGKAVHTVLSFTPADVTYQLEYFANVDACDSTAHEITAAYLWLREQNLAVIEGLDINARLPVITSVRDFETGEPDGPDLYAGCANLYDPSYTGTPDLVTVLSFPIDDDDAWSGAGVLGGSGEVYADADSLYVATRSTVNDGRDYWSHPSSVIHALTLDAAAGPATYVASGAVDGVLLNQFAMDEHEGFLRTAVTASGGATGKSNALYVMEPNDGVLDIVGKIEGIAPSEDIRSVRFDGDRGFIVTFKKTDPLFALDLADPRQPRIAGELHIPGFSTYMHLLDDQHLLTIGYDASDQGNFAWFTGVLLQIFDVSDMNAPTLTHKTVIGTRGTSSEALDNHLAFTFFRERGMLAVPMGICEGGDTNGGYGTTMTFNGLLVYDVSAETGIALHGAVDHGDYGDCYNWWQYPTSDVKRSIFMDDFVYSMSGNALIVTDTRDFTQHVATMPLQGLPQTECAYY